MLDNYDEPNQTTSTNGKPMDSKESEKKPQRIADLFFESSEVLRKELYDQYRESRKPIILRISQDRTLSNFDRFNKRFRISWGMQVTFKDNLPITQDDTRACYNLMIKIADLWFAFEHLQNVCSGVIQKCPGKEKSKVDCFSDEILNRIGFYPITTNFNELLWSNVIQKTAWRREIYMIFDYLKKITQGRTSKLIEEGRACIKSRESLQPKHVFSICYGLRNAYAHEGVVAALGSRGYHVKRSLYSVLYDTLILYSLALANAYCKTKLSEINNLQSCLRVCDDEA